jgi:nitrate reductase gamma subunit
MLRFIGLCAGATLVGRLSVAYRRLHGATTRAVSFACGGFMMFGLGAIYASGLSLVLNATATIAVLSYLFTLAGTILGLRFLGEVEAKVTRP